LADEQSRDNFHREALTLSKLNHPTIATIYDFDRHEETDFLVTEYVPGTSLHEQLLKGRMPEDDILRLSTQLAEGIAAAHGQGIVHRDLKPGNLRVMPDGRLKILDFGLAKPVAVLAPESPTESTVGAPAVAGTLLYMSPEQLRGEPADVRADIYSIGAVLYEMGTGRAPFESAHIANLVEAVLHKVPLPPTRLRPELSAHLEQIVLKCLEKEPAHRYQSALELLTDLRRAGRAATQEKSVAVLYFENLSGQREDEYFRDGITEDITTELSKIKELRLLPFRGSGLSRQAGHTSPGWPTVERALFA
jgi:serine/threonine protein kinase